MNPTTITIVSFGLFDRKLLEKISEAVAREYNCTVVIKDAYVDISIYFDPVRRQYNGDKLLKLVDNMQFDESFKVIGLFNVDIFIPILTYIFGQAQLSGRSGIASMYRLSNDRYGIANDNDILLERFKKEVIHELGHLLGLIHCYTPTCVMRSSTYVEDIDQKEAQLCVKCKEVWEAKL